MNELNNVQIKIADWQEDSATLQHIRRTVFIEEQAVPEALEWDEHDKTATHFLVYVNNTPVATARLTTDGQIGRMAVLQAYRNQTIGQQLLSFVVETANKQHFDSVFLHAQVHVIGFYKKQGFIEKGGIFMDANIPHREMIKHIGVGSK
jgi:predicted GNAT family N-acyltransferase